MLVRDGEGTRWDGTVRIPANSIPVVLPIAASLIENWALTETMSFVIGEASHKTDKIFGSEEALFRPLSSV